MIDTNKHFFNPRFQNIWNLKLPFFEIQPLALNNILQINHTVMNDPDSE